MTKEQDNAVWTELGVRDPYWAVMSEDEFRHSNLDDAAKAEFFRFGREHLDEIWRDLQAASGSETLRPSSAIDYGCGVGRILIPLAERCEKITGVDISPGMLDEAQSNAAARHLENIRFEQADSFLSDDQASFDLVHCFIVLQHIPPPVGRGIIAKLAERLTVGGVGMVHVTYEHTATWFTRLRFLLYRDVPGMHRLSNLVQRRNFPFVPMYEYDLNDIRQLIRSKSCTIVSEKDTDHGFLGKMLFIRKEPADDRNGGLGMGG